MITAFAGLFLFFHSRYASYFLVWLQIFFIFFIGMICFEVQNPNFSCRSSVNSVLV